MNVSLTPELEEYVAGKVSSGIYQSASDVVRDALLALREKEDRERKLAALRRELDVGIAEAEKGQLSPLTRDEIETMKQRGRDRIGKKS